MDGTTTAIFLELDGDALAVARSLPRRTFESIRARFALLKTSDALGFLVAARNALTTNGSLFLTEPASVNEPELDVLAARAGFSRRTKIPSNDTTLVSFELKR